MSSMPSLRDDKLPPAFDGRASRVSISRPAAPGGRRADKNESELIRRVGEGDVQAFHDLVRRRVPGWGCGSHMELSVNTEAASGCAAVRSLVLRFSPQPDNAGEAWGYYCPFG